MMHRFSASRVLLIGIFLLAASVFFSCSENFDKEDPTLAEIINAGKGYLVEGNGASAADAFTAAKKIDSTNTDARFGLMLAHEMQFTNLIDEMVQLLGSVDLGGGTQPVGTITSGQGLPIGDYVHTFLTDTLVNVLSDSENIYEDFLDEPDFQFMLDEYKLTISDMELISFGGEFDKTDLHFIAALNSLMDGLVHFLLAYNLNFDFENLNLPKLKPDATVAGTIGAYLRFVEDLLADENYPDFLYLDETDGAYHLKRAGLDFGNFFIRLNTSLDALALERDDQQDDQVWYFDENHDGYYNPDTDFVGFGDMFSLSPELVKAVKVTGRNLAEAIYDGSTKDFDPFEPNLLTPSDFDELLRAFDILPISLGPIEIDGLPYWFGIEVGAFFSYPESDGLRNLLYTVIDFWNLIEDLS